MNKNQLIDLLNMDIMDKNHKESVNLLLSLNQNEVKILLDNKENARSLFLLISYIRDTKHYKFALNKALEIKDASLLSAFVMLACNTNLLESDHYEFTLNQALKIKNAALLGEFYKFVYKTDLLKSDHYEFTINKALEIKNICLLFEFIELAWNTDLLKSTHYVFALNKASEIKDSDLLQKFRKLAIDPNLLKSDYYELVLTKAVEIKNPDLLEKFCMIIFNKNVANRPDLIKIILNINTDERIYKVLSQIFEISERLDKEKVDYIFNSITAILKINNVEVINELLCEILMATNNEINSLKIKKVNHVELNEKIEKSIEDRNIVNVISSSTNEEIIKSLEDFSTDEDITPSTFVRKFGSR